MGLFLLNLNVNQLYLLKKEANMISISMQNVCSLPSKLDIPDFIEFIESHTINCFVEMFVCGFNATSGNLYDLVEDNIFNDFGCYGMT